MSDEIKKEALDFQVEELKKKAAAKAKLEAEAKAKKKKEAEAKAKLPPPKKYYDVKVECMLPATLTYRVLAEDAVKAAELIKGMSPTGVRHKIIGKKDIKLTVYDSGSSIIRWVKNLLR
jgi:hypothetical protein